MLYTLLCYNDEAMTSAWTSEEEAAVMARLDGVHRKWAAHFGPVARLMPTSAATTFRKDEQVVLDGPYAETKEQLLGFYFVEVEGLDMALQIARDLGEANPGGAYEIRPVMLYSPGTEAPG
ncbi:MAG: YciI family protein [Paracoccus sp. BP8]|nr:MAG: YciI family protein [Paracoccus sp. BP8]